MFDLCVPSGFVDPASSLQVQNQFLKERSTERIALVGPHIEDGNLCVSLVSLLECLVNEPHDS